MIDTPESPDATDKADGGGAADGPPFLIEKARSSRSRCKGCRRPIQKDKLRFGVRIEGPFGTGYLWHHLNCAAKRRIGDVEEAYALGIGQGVEGLPTLEELKQEQEARAEEREKKKAPPYVEVAPTGRSKCRGCGDAIDKGGARVVLLRSVEFYGQTRVGPINVHPKCVGAALAADDNATEMPGFEEALRRNSADVDAAVVDRVVREIGPVG